MSGPAFLSSLYFGIFKKEKEKKTELPHLLNMPEVRSCPGVILGE